MTPRFSLSCTDELLATCHTVLEEIPGALFTSHLNENEAEIATVAELFGGSDYVSTYERHGLVDRRSVFAHNVHPTDVELKVLGDSGATVAHCPTSNAVLGSGLFPLARHLDHGVRVALGSDVGAGTGFSLLKEGLAGLLLPATDRRSRTSAQLRASVAPGNDCRSGGTRARATSVS